jgi:hypothetical protein
MSFLNPVLSQNGCFIVNTAVPDGTVRNALFLQNEAGFGYTSLAASKPFAIKVSDQIDYEISFWLKQTIELPGFSLSVKTFNGDFIETNTYDIRTSLPNRNFFSQTDKLVNSPNQWIFCRYILYGSNQTPVLGKQPKTSLAVGTNLVMSQTTNNIFVNIQAFLTSGVYVWNFKVKPLRTPFSNSFIRSGNLIEIWRKINNNALSGQQIDRAAQQYLLPYNTKQNVIEL